MASPRRPSPRDSLADVAALIAGPGALQLTARGGAVALPPEVVDVLRQAVAHLQRGDAVAVVARRAELTTQQAAALLGMSRQHLVRLIDAGKLRARVTAVGKHRRVAAADVLRLKAKREAAQARAAEIAAYLDGALGPRDPKP